MQLYFSVCPVYFSYVHSQTETDIQTSANIDHLDCHFFENQANCSRSVCRNCSGSVRACVDKFNIYLVRGYLTLSLVFNQFYVGAYFSFHFFILLVDYWKFFANWTCMWLLKYPRNTWGFYCIGKTFFEIFKTRFALRLSDFLQTRIQSCYKFLMLSWRYWWAFRGKRQSFNWSPLLASCISLFPASTESEWQEEDF